MKYLETNMLILSLLLLILSNGYAFNSVHFSKNAYVGSKPSLKMMINNNRGVRIEARIGSSRIRILILNICSVRNLSCNNGIRINNKMCKPYVSWVI